jgi:deoxyribodipyrimidine photo-lyase
MEPAYATGLVWFRRDLRANDHAALYRALTQCQQVHCVFVFDREILATLPRADRRVEFIRASLVELDASLRKLGGHEQVGLIVLHAMAREAVPALACSLGVQAVFANHDDEPQALERDRRGRTPRGAGGQAFDNINCVI